MGTVKLRISVGVEGDVDQVAVISGYPSLAESAQTTIAQWKFAPRVNGPIRFALDCSLGFDDGIKAGAPDQMVFTGSREIRILTAAPVISATADQIANGS
jgi:TonB-like protein